MNINEIDCLINKILSELHSLKSDKLKSIRMQDFNIDIIKKTINKPLKSTKINSIEQNNQPKTINVSSLTTEKALEITYGEKINLSSWRLKRRAKKIYKLQNKIDKGYINGIEKSISIVEKLYDKFLDGKLL